jgi:hypothetical protein
MVKWEITGVTYEFMLWGLTSGGTDIADQHTPGNTNLLMLSKLD